MGFFGFGKKSGASSGIDWIQLRSAEELDDFIKKESFNKPVILFKHSTSCAISSMAMSRLENYWDIDGEMAVPVYLDLLRHRDISNKIAADLGVIHESPQILIVKDGECVYQASHSQISVADIKRNL